MTQHIPLNGNGPLQAVRNALSASASRPVPNSLRSALEGTPEREDDLPEDAPDGTGGATKSETPRRSRATDPSQGHAPAPQKRNRDPLLDALMRTRTMSRR